MMLESDGPGGAEMMVLRLSHELRRRGHFVLPVGPEKGIGWLGLHFRRGGFPTEVFKLRRPIDPGCVRGLVQLFREYEIDTVHSHEFTMAVYGCAATRVLGLPHIITMHGGLTVCDAMRRRIALRWAMRNSEHTVVVSAATRKQFSDDLGVAASRFNVVPNGVPAIPGDAARVRSELRLRAEDCVVLAVGNLEVHKGHRVLVDALSELRGASNSHWKLIIAGGRGGDQHEALLKQVEDLALADKVNILLNRDDIPDLLAAATVFVMPSFREGLPMALLEAMLAGKAIVASRTAGIPEAITDGREGLLVSPGDTAALSRALDALITSGEKREELARFALDRANQDFTVQVMADRYERLYAADRKFAHPERAA
jgi:glycosyltransferase involved in cell wall biosynthesis